MLALLAVGARYVIADAQCEAWCAEKCSDLNGDVRVECADCPHDGYRCGPGRPGFDMPVDPLLPSAPLASLPYSAEQSEPVPLSVPLDPLTPSARGGQRGDDCRRIQLRELEHMTHSQLAEVMKHPVLILGAMDDWTVPRNLSSFVAEFGDHQVLARRTRFGRARDTTAFLQYEERKRTHREGVSAEAPHVSVREFAEHYSQEFTVMFTGEPGMSVLEEELVAELGRRRSIPSILKQRSYAVFFSFGSFTQGVNTANHGFTWIALMAGEKRWHVAPPETPMPRDPKCTDRSDHPTSFACTQFGGEIITLPTAWWHATCNYHNETIGVGGQDSCDLGCQDEVHSGRRKHFCAGDEHTRLACWSQTREKDEV